MDMLKVNGKLIVDCQEHTVVLKGYNVGNWMMLENFMLGYAGSEEEFRAAVLHYAGRENYEYFFDKFMDSFLGEDDIVFMEKIGVNCIRVPFNYRHFELDNAPYQYNPKAFKRLDWLVKLCKQHHIYVILDLHAVQGYQSTGWHCDNHGVPTRLYANALERERFYRLWAHIAEHYRDEAAIAGYDVINEPDAVTPEEADILNQIYREVVNRIRKADPNHIIFLAGNAYDRHFDYLEPPFTHNLAYTCHYYLAGCTSSPIHYPSDEFGNLMCNRTLIECQMDNLDCYMQEHNVPCWVGEFGVRLNYEGYTEDRLRMFGDQLDCICQRGHHYSIWSYKDIGFLSTVTIKPDSPWMRFVADTLALKTRYCVDKNFRVNEDWGVSLLLGLKEPNGLNDRYGKAKEAITDAMKTALSTEICDRLGRKFAGLSRQELDALADSFAFNNCYINEERLKVIKQYGALEAKQRED